LNLNITGERFHSSQRIRKRVDYQRASRKGRRYSTRNFVVYVIDNGLDSSRLGITVRKKVGIAVYRNHLKRYIREFFRRDNSIFPDKCDISIIVSPRDYPLDYSLIVNEVTELLKRNA